MRISIETPFDAPFEADTLDVDPDLDGAFDVLTEDGERLRVHGWTCTVDVIDRAHVPAGWYQVEA